MTRKVIIDTDPGIDDAMAILFALQTPKIDVLGLTTTFGNVNVKQSTINALTLVELAQSDTPVAKGADKPLVMPPREHATFVHGDDGLGNTHNPQPKGQPISLDAAEFIVEQIKAHPHEVTLIALGPLGNLAKALALEPKIAEWVDEVIIMGGAAFTLGNLSPVAEANILNDPDAAEQVFNAPWTVTMIGLDVTHKVMLTNAHLNAIHERNPRLGSFLYDISQHYINFYSQQHHIEGCYFHDASTIAYALDPTLFKIQRATVRVVTEGIAIGQTIVSPAGFSYPTPGWTDRPLHNICVEVASDRLLHLFVNTF